MTSLFWSDAQIYPFILSSKLFTLFKIFIFLKSLKILKAKPTLILVSINLISFFSLLFGVYIYILYSKSFGKKSLIICPSDKEAEISLIESLLSITLLLVE